MKLAKLLLICLVVSPAGKVHAVPPPDAGVTIGGALIDDRGEPVTSDGILLIEGPSKTSNSSGIGPYGGTLFSYVLDGIPRDVAEQNVLRHLKLQLRAVTDGMPEIFSATSEPFPLTFRGNVGAGAGCTELLHFGPGGFVSPAPALVSFGCPEVPPPPLCADLTASAIATARDYRKATQSVKKECGREISNSCNAALTEQAGIFAALEQAQLDIAQNCP